MKKIVLHGTIGLSVILGIWFTLQQIDWITLLRIKEVSRKTEQYLGDRLWKNIQKSEIENEDSNVLNPIDSIVDKVCIANGIDRQTIKLHIINKEEVNAFAIPNGYLIIYSDLIKHSSSQEELAGVICHEIAHIALHHVMKKISRELGLSILTHSIAGEGGDRVLGKMVNTLSSTAFDRSMEKEADIKAVDYMIKAKINPIPFARFLYRFSAEEGKNVQYLTWLNTHPASKERASYIIEYCRNRPVVYQEVLSQYIWDKLKEHL